MFYISIATTGFLSFLYTWYILCQPDLFVYWHLGVSYREHMTRSCMYFLFNLTISNFRLDCLTYLHLMSLNVIINIISYIYICHFTFCFLGLMSFYSYFLPLLLSFALNRNFLMLLLDFFNDYLYLYISHFPLLYIYIFSFLSYFLPSCLL